MTRAKELLDAATPLPWWSREDGVYGPDGDGIAEVFGNAAHEANAEDQGALIVYAVNRLPDYEAAVEALERCINVLADHVSGPDTMWLRERGEAVVQGRGALRRLKEGVTS